MACIGVLRLSADCGRWWLYSATQRSSVSSKSSLLQNRWVFKTSARAQWRWHAADAGAGQQKSALNTFESLHGPFPGHGRQVVAAGMIAIFSIAISACYISDRGRFDPLLWRSLCSPTLQTVRKRLSLRTYPCQSNASTASPFIRMRYGATRPIPPGSNHSGTVSCSSNQDGGALDGARPKCTTRPNRATPTSTMCRWHFAV